MHLDQRLAMARRPINVDAVLGEKLAEQMALLFELFRALVVREQGRDFVAESGDAGRLEADDRGTAREGRRERVEQLPEQRVGTVEHAPIVQRPGAAQALRDRKSVV